MSRQYVCQYIFHKFVVCIFKIQASVVMISYLSEFPHTDIALLFPPDNPSDTATLLTESLILNLSLHRHVFKWFH